MLPTKEELSLELVRIYKQLNKPINRNDVVRHSKYKYWIYKKIFGSITNAKKYAKIPINQEKLQHHSKNKELNKMLDKILKIKDGILLSNFEEIISKKSKIKIKCKKCNYEFDTSIERLNRTWCLECSGTKKRTIEDVYEAAKKKNLECLSVEYLGANCQLKFKCSIGHTFKLSPSKLWNTASYCSECSSGLYERITRCYFEQIFNDKFPSIYPNWLINSRGNKMQLDGYSENFKIAFEHQGRQHYEKNFFTKDNFSLKDRIQLDLEKIKLCEENGVKLFIIPELEYTLCIKDLKKHIKQNCVNFNIELPVNYNDIVIDLKKAYSNNYDEKFIKIKEIIESKNGILLSKNYLGAKSKIEIMCKHGNIFSKDYYHLVIKKSWCRCKDCVEKKVNKADIEKFIKLYLSGLTIKEASEACGFKKSYGFIILSEKGLTRNKSEARKLVKPKKK